MSNKLYVTRRDFLATAIAGPTAFAMGRTANAQYPPSQNKFRFYVGTYTSTSKSEGIYVCDFNALTGAISLLSMAKGVADPSFLTIDHQGKYLFAVNELLEFEGKPAGSVSSFAIDSKTGGLKFISKQSSIGAAPCHISISKDGRFILVANYLGGNVAVYPVGIDGRIGQSSDLVQHSGFGPNKERQLSAHAHSITLDNNGRFAVAADLGIDRVMIYAFDRSRGKLTPNSNQPNFQAKPGSGPRHFDFHPNGKLAFIINELDSSVTSLSYDPNSGTLREIMTISTLPRGFSGSNTCADIHSSRDGKFLYASNRGSDTIAVFKIDQETGSLKYIENTPTGGKKPRNFVIDPTGNYLLAANQDTGNIVVFRIDRASGRLKKTGQGIEIPAPVCIKFPSLGA